MLLRQASRLSDSQDNNNPLAVQHRILDEKQQKESLKNPTPAMKTIIKRREQREKEREQMTWHQQLQHLSNRNNSSNVKASGGASTSKAKNDAWDLSPNELTPAMKDVMKKRCNRVSLEYDVPMTPDPSESEEATSEDDSDGDSEEEALSDGFITAGHRKNIIQKHQNNRIRRTINYTESESEDDEDSGGFSEYDELSEEQNGDADETESYINSSDEEDMFPTKDGDAISDFVRANDEAKPGVISR